MAWLVALVVSAACGSGRSASWTEGEVPYERLLDARNDSSNWLMYSGAYDGQRYSLLADVDRTNVQRLTRKWVYPIDTPYPVETTPLVVDGVMYLTRPPNDVVALDAETGEERWTFKWPLPDELPFCCNRINRGVAVLNDTVYIGTLDAHLVAIDARTGREKWNVEVGNWRDGFRISSAPLAVKDMILTGVALAQEHLKFPPDQVQALRGRIDAYEAATGALRWRFQTVPVQDEPGSETWEQGSWALGGGSTWVTGSYDPSLNLIYWGVGAPNMFMFSELHPGDNLFTSSILALNVDDGRKVWHYQTTPHDTHDWDAAHTLILADLETDRTSRTLLLNPNRNGFYYVLDRQTGRFVTAQAFAKQTWADGFDADGRPIVTRQIAPTISGNEVAPSMDGATSWWSPSFSPRSGLLYVTAHDASEVFYTTEMPDVFDEATPKRLAAALARRFDPSQVVSAVRALDARTGTLRWEHPLPLRSTPGLLSTAGDLLFTGSTLGDFWALDAHTGAALWHTKIDGWVHTSPVTFRSNGKQLVAIASNAGIYTFAIDP